MGLFTANKGRAPIGEGHIKRNCLSLVREKKDLTGFLKTLIFQTSEIPFFLVYRLQYGTSQTNWAKNVVSAKKMGFLANFLRRSHHINILLKSPQLHHMPLLHIDPIIRPKYSQFFFAEFESNLKYQLIL